MAGSVLCTAPGPLVLLALVRCLLSSALGSLLSLKLETYLLYGIEAALEDMEAVNDYGCVGE